MPSINTKFMGEIPIIVPPLDIQEKITRVLRILDEKIDLNLQINKNLPPYPCVDSIGRCLCQTDACIRMARHLAKAVTRKTQNGFRVC